MPPCVLTHFTRIIRASCSGKAQMSGIFVKHSYIWFSSRLEFPRIATVSLIPRFFVGFLPNSVTSTLFSWVGHLLPLTLGRPGDVLASRVWLDGWEMTSEAGWRCKNVLHFDGLFWGTRSGNPATTPRGSPDGPAASKIVTEVLLHPACVSP